MIEVTDLTDENALSCIEEPDFEHKTMVHDWRNYVPDLIQRHWDKLSLESKMIVFAMADDRASAENWD